MLHRTHSHAPNIYNPSYSLPIAFIHSFIRSLPRSCHSLPHCVCRRLRRTARAPHHPGEWHQRRPMQRAASCHSSWWYSSCLL